jgi:DNA-binding winged helix-turn-helix (wHTH) protein/tetratricopeptide (TPR) repeat protein
MIYVFGDCELDTRLYELRRAGMPVKIEPQVFDVLVYLIQRRDRVVPRDELLERLWFDRNVTVNEEALKRCIGAARRAIGDSGKAQRFITTQYRRGYRFVAPVEERIFAAAFEPSPVDQHVQGTAPAETAEPGRRAAIDPHGISGVTEPAARRPLTDIHRHHTSSRFVGRERELTVLHELLAQVAEGQGRVVGIMGEPGMGKSRLLYEFRQSLAAAPVEHLEGHCLSYGSAIPYLPVLDLLRQSCGISETDDPEAVATKVCLSLQEVGMDAAEGAPYLLQLLGVKEGTKRLAMLSPEAIQAQSLVLLRQVLRRRSWQHPLVVVMEDLHWIDKTSEDFVASLVEDLVGTSILLLATYRPGYRPIWMEKSYASQIALQRLSSRDSLTLVHSILVREHLPDAVVQMILEKAEGNPFFLEELTRAVIEHGDFRSGRTVPDTIQGVIMARIDRLSGEPKRLLQTASILGRTFSMPLLEALWEGPRFLEPLLLELKRLEFLYERVKADEPVYVFKHALTQEVAYESLSFARRQALHAAAGRALERLYGNRLEEVYDRLAYHYAKAEHADKAVTYLARFAEKSARHHAHVEAITALQDALVHAGRLPADRERDCLLLDLHLRLARSFFALGRYQETLEYLLQQQDRLGQLQNASLAGRYALLCSQTSSNLGDWRQAAQSAQRAIKEASRCHDDPTVGQAYHILAMERYWAGQPQQGVTYSQQAIAVLERTDKDRRLGMSYFVLGLNLLLLGNFEQALEAATRTRTIGEALEDLRLQTFAAWMRGWIHATRGEWDAGVAACQHALECSSDPLNTAFAIGWLGYAHLERKDPSAAIPLLEQAAQGMHQFGYRRLEGLYTVFLSEAHLVRGHPDTAHDLAHQGLALAQEEAYRVGIGWAQRTLGRIALSYGTSAEAECFLRKALTIFAAMPARFEVGRTRLALAELAYRQGNREAALTHLTEAHRLFWVLRTPVYVTCTVRRARVFGMSLPLDRRS